MKEKRTSSGFDFYPILADRILSGSAKTDLTEVVVLLNTQRSHFYRYWLLSASPKADLLLCYVEIP